MTHPLAIMQEKFVDMSYTSVLEIYVHSIITLKDAKL